MKNYGKKAAKAVHREGQIPAVSSTAAAKRFRRWIPREVTPDLHAQLRIVDLEIDGKTESRTPRRKLPPHPRGGPSPHGLLSRTAGQTCSHFDPRTSDR